MLGAAKDRKMCLEEGGVRSVPQPPPSALFGTGAQPSGDPSITHPSPLAFSLALEFALVLKIIFTDMYQISLKGPQCYKNLRPCSKNICFLLCCQRQLFLPSGLLT